MKTKARVVVIGSGFGGSVMAMKLAKEGIAVCVLERGRAYAPGSFPRTPHGVRNNFWDPKAGQYGMYNLWAFKPAGALVASGLGGGSLIYSSVCLKKDDSWFYYYDEKGERRPWPITRKDLDPHYENVLEVLQPEEVPFSSPKMEAMRIAAGKLGYEFQPARLAVKFRRDETRDLRTPEAIPDDVASVHGPGGRHTCRYCGECNVGCNDGSKNSLDFNYLAIAKKHGAQLLPNCEVTQIERAGDSFKVTYREHTVPKDPRRSHLPEKDIAVKTMTMEATHVVLAAGALGTPYLLLKNRDRLGTRNPKLGTRFSGNGDYFGIVAGVNLKDEKGNPIVLDSSEAPIITSYIRLPDGAESTPPGSERGLYIEDGGQPEWVAWVAELSQVHYLLWRALRIMVVARVQRLFGLSDNDFAAELRTLIGTEHASSTTMPLLGMGIDTADGVLSLDKKTGRLSLKWPEKGAKAYYKRIRKTAGKVAEAMGGKFKLTPLADAYNASFTVHPLGGCPMGVDAQEGYVNHQTGEVFDVPNLYVADGSVMPGPVGANPSLTIAAVADRFADNLIPQIKRDYALHA